MTEREALQFALETLEIWKGYMPALWDKTDEQAITAIKEALAQPEYQSTADKSKLEKVPAKGALLAQPKHEWVRGECVKCGQSMEQPEQKPVVWMYQDKSTHEVRFQKHMRDFVDHGQTYETPLYTSPSQRNPLTRKEVLTIIDKHPAEKKTGLPMFYRDQVLDIARAIEAAHGIKGEA